MKTVTSQGQQNLAPPRRGGELLSGLGTAVQRLRAEKGLSRRVLAERAGLSSRFVAQLESGRGNISVTNLDAVASALGVPLAALLGPVRFPVPSGKGPGGTDWMRAEILRRVRRAGAEELLSVFDLLGASESADGGAVRPVIALMGLRGAGKSTIGPLLAERLELEFLELDELVQERTGLAIGEIYELHGERYYRTEETRALLQVVEMGKPVVVSVSGGIVNVSESFLLLRERTRLVWLKASPALHMERVRSQGDQRPMRNRPDAMAELKQLLSVRNEQYNQAPYSIDTSRLSPQACAKRLTGELRGSG